MNPPIHKRDEKTGKAVPTIEYQFLDYEDNSFSNTYTTRKVNILEDKLIDLLRSHEYSYVFIAEKMLISLERKHERREKWLESFEYKLFMTIYSFMEKENPLTDRFQELLSDYPK